MLGYIKGEIKTIEEKKILITCDNVGYWVYVPRKTVESIHTNSQIELYTYQKFSTKNETFETYGFQKYNELQMFEKLITISGVGPKSAISALSIASADEIEKAIYSGDYSLLQKISGIGKKTAERIVIELKDKILTSGDDLLINNNLGDVIEALVNLGYKKHDIQKIIPKLSKEGKTNEDLIKIALNELSNQKP